MLDFFTSRFDTIKEYLSSQSVPTTAWLDIFKWEFWTEGPLSTEMEYGLFSVIFVIVMIIILLRWRKKLKKLDKHVPVYQTPIEQILSLIFFIVIMFVAYAFFRAQAITYLSSRLVLLSAIFVIFIWLGVIFYYLKRVIPPKKTSYLEKERFFRYLPKSKS